MLFKRLVCGIILLAFGLTGVIPPSAYPQNIPNTPANILSLTPAFHPVMIQGMRVHPENPLRFDFIVDTGDGFVDVNGTQFKEETKKLIKYFLASLTVPEDQMWVNLSPYEKNRIIADGLGHTELGADMLSEDFILKQLTSSLIYPDSRTGRSFWKKVYTEAQENFGRTDIPVNTFNKVWIVPDKAVVYEHGNTVYVAESHLKVMLEEDYLALKKYQRQPGSLSPENIVIPAKAGTRNKNAINALGSQIVREIVLPELDKEVNNGKNFANLRQIYHAMILAVWFKLNLQKSLLGQIYADKNKTAGVDARDMAFRRKIYEQYIRSFKKGVYNYIREENDPVTGEMIPRKYFSGGVVGLDEAQLQVETGEEGRQKVLDGAMGTRVLVDSAMQGVGPDTNAVPGRDIGAIKELITQKLGVDSNLPIVDKLTHVEEVTQSFLASQAQEEKNVKTRELLAANQPHGPPKIALIHYSYPPPGWGGVNIVMVEEVKFFIEHGIPVRIITGSPSNIIGNANEQHVYIEGLDILKKDDPIFKSSVEGDITSKAFRALEQRFYESIKSQIEDRDIIIIHNVLTLKLNLPFTVALHRIITENPQKQFIILVHNAEAQYQSGPLSILNPPLELQNVKYATVSNSYLQELSQIYGFPASKFSILNPGVQPYSPLNMTPEAVEDFKRNGLLGKDRGITIAFPTRLDGNKDIGKVLLVFKKLKEKIPQGVRLVIAVPGISPEENTGIIREENRIVLFNNFMSQVREKLGVGTVDFLEREGIRSSVLEDKDIILLDPGAINDYQRHRQYILDIMALSDFLLYPSNMETFGMFPVEAATTGTEIIATNLLPHQESVGSHALLFDNKAPLEETVQKIVDRIAIYKENQLSRDEVQRKTLERYDWNNLMASQLVPLLLNVIKTRPLLSNAVAALSTRGLDKAFEMVVDALYVAGKVPSEAGKYLDDIPGALDIIREHQTTRNTLPKYVYDVMRLVLGEYSQSGGPETVSAALRDIGFSVNEILRDPRNTISRIEIARILKERSFLDDALTVYNEVLHIDERNTQARIEMAGIFESRGELKAAMNKYEEVQKIDPPNTHALEGIARLTNRNFSIERSEFKERNDLAMKTTVSTIDNNIERINLSEGGKNNILVTSHEFNERFHIQSEPQHGDSTRFTVARPEGKAVTQVDLPGSWVVRDEVIAFKQEMEFDHKKSFQRGVQFVIHSQNSSATINPSKVFLHHLLWVRIYNNPGWLDYLRKKGDFEYEPEFRRLLEIMQNEGRSAEFKEKFGVELEEVLKRGTIQMEIDEPGNRIIFKKSTWSGKNHYVMEFLVPEGFKITHQANGEVQISGNRPLDLTIRSSTDFKPLTPFTTDELLNDKGKELMREDKDFARAERNFEFLAFHEALLAGSWNFLSRFTRDGLTALFNMWPVLSQEAKKAGLGGIMEGVAEDGIVSGTNEWSDEMSDTYAMGKFNWEFKSGDQKNAFETLKMILDGKVPVKQWDTVLDNTFMFPSSVNRWAQETNTRDLRSWLRQEHQVRGRQETRLTTLLRNWNYTLTAAAPYMKAWQNLRDKYQSQSDDQIILEHRDEFNALAVKLVRSISDLGNWRDVFPILGVSNGGLGRFPEDINVNLIPTAITAIGEFVDKLKSKEVGMGDEVSIAIKKNSLNVLGQYFNNPSVRQNMEEIWSRARIRQHFLIHQSAEKIRERFRIYLEALRRNEVYFGEDWWRNEKELNMLLNREIVEGSGIKISDFVYNDSVYQQAANGILKGGLDFTGLLLDENGTPVPIMHSDDVYFLMYGKPTKTQIQEILKPIFLSYPLGLGLWHDRVGFVVSNGVHAPKEWGIFVDDHGNPFNLFDMTNGKKYHGASVWGWPMYALLYGLQRAAFSAIGENGQLNKGWRWEDIKELQHYLDIYAETIENLGPLANSELWGFKPDDSKPGLGEAVPSRDSTPVQLWSIAPVKYVVEMALKRIQQGIIQEWKSKLVAGDIQNIFGQHAPEYSYSENGKGLTIRGLTELSEVVNNGTNLTPYMRNGLLQYVHNLIMSEGNGSEALARQVAGMLKKVSNEKELESFLHAVGTVSVDHAIISKPGGIDLNASMLDLQVRRDGNNATFPVGRREAIQVNGFTPIIIRITPMNSPLLSASG